MTQVNTIINADCLDALPTLANVSVNFVLTDPPYIANYRPRDGRVILNDNREAWLKPAFREIYRVLARDSFCVSFYGWPKVDRFTDAFLSAGFRIVGHFVCPKAYASSVGYVQYQHESAFLLAKGSPCQPLCTISDVLEWKYTGNKHHPTQKPLTALLPLVQTFSRPGDVVLDPFAGSGSSLLAAKMLGRNYIGIELDAEHCAVARSRLT